MTGCICAIHWWTECFCRILNFLLLQPSWVTSPIKVSESIPEAAMQDQAVTLPPPRLTDELVCFGSRADPSFQHFFLEVHLDSRTFVAHLCILLQIPIRPSDFNLWFASLGMSSTSLRGFFLNTGLWYLRSCTVEAVGDVTDCFLCFVNAFCFPSPTCSMSGCCGTPVVFVFFRTFQIVVTSVLNAEWLDFPFSPPQ